MTVDLRAERTTVLLADDDRAIRESLVRALELEGYQVIPVADGVSALAALRSSSVQLAVLDVMMPGVDGLGVCQVLRMEGNTIPVLMLTARVRTADRVAGLDAGADDYLPKPFELDELLARLRALTRRAQPPDPLNQRLLRAGDLTLDALARRAWRGPTELALTRTEFDLLELLLRNVGIVLDHGTIQDRIWGYPAEPASKNLAVYVGYLRRKLGDPPLIHTIRGVGYTIR